MRLYLLDADYKEEGSSVIRLFCKDAEGKTIICLDYNFEPYFYILPKQGKENEVRKKVENIKSIKIKRAEVIEKLLGGEKRKFLKVFCFLSTDVPKVREIVKVWDEVEDEYEYSINFYKRYLIDNQIEGWIDVEGQEVKKEYRADKVIKIEKIRPVSSDKMPELKLISFDIESVDEAGKPIIVMLSMKSKGFEKVLTYRKDKHYGKYVEVLKDEKELLERFVEIIKEQDPDILTGFNCVPKGTLILCSDGIEKPIEKIISEKDNSNFVGIENPGFSSLANQKIINYHHYKQPTLVNKITTKIGNLSATDKHRLLVGSEEGMGWKYSKDVEIGELLARPAKLEVVQNFENLNELIDFTNGKFIYPTKEFVKQFKKLLSYGSITKLSEHWNIGKGTLYHPSPSVWNFKRIKEACEVFNLSWKNVICKLKEFKSKIKMCKLPSLDCNLTYFLGLLASDGSLSKNRVVFYNKNKDLLNFVGSTLKQLIPTTKIEKREQFNQFGEWSSHVLRAPSHGLSFILNELGLPFGDKSKAMWNLQKIFSLKEELIGAFIAGIYDGDGTRSDTDTMHRGIYISSKSPSLTSWLQKLLLRFGIVSTAKKYNDNWSVYIFNTENNREKIIEYILPHLKNRIKKVSIEKLIKYYVPENKRSYEILPKFIGKILREIRTRHGIKIKQIDIPHSTVVYYERGYTYPHLTTIKKYINKLLKLGVKDDKLEEIVKICKAPIFWDRIISKESTFVNEVFDLTTDKHNYIANGFIVHNSDEFDAQIIQKRAEELKVDLAISRDFSKLKFARRARISTARFKGLVHIDLFQFINNVLSSQLQTEVLTLDAVSAELLGDKKIEIDYEEILEDWRKGKDLGKLAEYCLKDSELTLRLGEFILPQIHELAELSGQLLFDTSRMTYSQLVEWYLFKRTFAMSTIIPNQPKWDEIEKRREYSPYEGGFVKEPIGGLHEDIAVMDFRSLYPSIIATFNISPETLNCGNRKEGHEVPGTDYWFCKKRKGFISSTIEELIKKRTDIKNKMDKVKKDSGEWKRLNNEQWVCKILANSSYGYFGFASSKWYCRECALSSAAFGRFYIKKVISEAEKEGFTVIYVDTDSMFVKTERDLKKKVKIFLEKVNKTLPGIIELNLQGIYKRGIFIPRGVGPGTAKKRYALIDEKGVLTIRGLEKVRRDWSNVAKDTQEMVLKLILEKKDVKGAVKYVKYVIKQLNDGKIPLKDLIIIEQLTKPLSEYKLIGPHVVAARKIKERGRPIGEGMPILFVITKGKGSISERSEPFEDVDINDIDNDYYIGHQIVPAALRVLTVLGVTEEELLGESLKGFLK